MAVDNATVQRIIQAELDRAEGYTILGRVRAALDSIIRKRELGLVSWDDQNWAAADHYLEGRWWVNLVGPSLRPAVTAGILVYDTAKLAGVNVAVGSNPASPWSPVVLAWALAGLEDGELDWKVRLALRPRLVAPPNPYIALAAGGVIRMATPPHL